MSVLREKFTKFFRFRLQLFSALAVQYNVGSKNATSFLMGQLSVAYGGTAEKLALLFPSIFTFLDFSAFID